MTVRAARQAIALAALLCSASACAPDNGDDGPALSCDDGACDSAGACTTVHQSLANARGQRLAWFELDGADTYEGIVSYSISEIAAAPLVEGGPTWPNTVAPDESFPLVSLLLVPRGSCSTSSDIAGSATGFDAELGELLVPFSADSATNIPVASLSRGEYELCLVKNADFPTGLDAIEVCADLSWQDANVAPVLSFEGETRYQLGDTVTLKLVPSDANDDAVTIQRVDDLPGPSELSEKFDEYNRRYYTFTWTPPAVSAVHSLRFQVSDGVHTVVRAIDIDVLGCQCNEHGCYFDGGGCNEHGCWVAGGGCDLGCAPSDDWSCSEEVSLCWNMDILRDACLLGAGVCSQSMTCSP